MTHTCLVLYIEDGYNVRVAVTGDFSGFKYHHHGTRGVVDDVNRDDKLYLRSRCYILGLFTCSSWGQQEQTIRYDVIVYEPLQIRGGITSCHRVVRRRDVSLGRLVHCCTLMLWMLYVYMYYSILVAESWLLVSLMWILCFSFMYVYISSCDLCLCVCACNTTLSAWSYTLINVPVVVWMHKTPAFYCYIS